MVSVEYDQMMGATYFSTKSWGLDSIIHTTNPFFSLYKNPEAFSIKLTMGQFYNPFVV